MAQTINVVFGATSVGGTADAITAVYSPILTALTNRRTLSFKATATNTGSVTFSPDGLTVRAITNKGGVPLVAGQIQENMICLIQYDLTNTRWELLNPASVLNYDQATTDIDMAGNGVVNVAGLENTTTGNVLLMSNLDELDLYSNTGELFISDDEVFLLHNNSGALFTITDLALLSTKYYKIEPTSGNHIARGGNFTLNFTNVNLPNETASRYLFLDASKNIDTKTTAQVLSDIGAQPLDSDLTTIAGLTPTNDDIMQYKAGAWANRTISQLHTDLLALIYADILFPVRMNLEPLSYSDSTTYYQGLGAFAPTTVDTRVDFNIGYAVVCVGAIVCVSSSNTPSGESLTLQLRNVTQGTSSSIGTFTITSMTPSESVTTFTGLNIPVASTDFICSKFDVPVMATNPTNARGSITFLFKRA